MRNIIDKIKYAGAVLGLALFFTFVVGIIILSVLRMFNVI